MSSTDTQHSHFILIGGPSVGKGYAGTPMQQQVRVHRMITGDMIRLRINSDHAFRSDWKKHIDHGHLLPDDVLGPMIRSRYDLPIRRGRKNIFWDGWHRTVSQVDEFFDEYTRSGENVLVVNITASENTCRERNEHRNQNANRSDGGAFDTRWEIFRRNVCFVIDRLRSRGAEIKCISGDLSLDQIARGVWAHWQRFTDTSEQMPEIKRHGQPADQRTQSSTQLAVAA